MISMTPNWKKRYGTAKSHTLELGLKVKLQHLEYLRLALHMHKVS